MAYELKQFYVEQLDHSQEQSGETHNRFKNGDIILAEYYLDDGKIKVARRVQLAGEDQLYFYFNTGLLYGTPVAKKHIIRMSIFKKN